MKKLLVELIGTFVFLSVILKSGEAIPIAIALAAAIYLGSGGHFNPAVSLMQFLNKKLSSTDLILYVGAQLLGAVIALAYYKMK